MRSRAAISLASALLVWLGGVQAASARWMTQPAPSPAGTIYSGLNSVSCLASSACVAVGYHVNRAQHELALAERFQGGRWRIQAVGRPGSASSLAGVSCVTRSRCTAAGYYDSRDGRVHALAEGWNGRRWSAQRVPDPAGAANTYLNSVSCGPGGHCTAVGYYEDRSAATHALAESWRGGHWSIQRVPGSPGTLDTHLEGVSCASASACTAVGYYLDGSLRRQGISEIWNGSSWTAEITAAPIGAMTSSLESVSCPSATDCRAVGDYTNASGRQLGLAERWEVTLWSVEPLPHRIYPSGSEYLAGVSCASASSCLAIGRSMPGQADDLALAEVWNGTSWAHRGQPHDPSQGTFLFGVSCPLSAHCTAVGTHIDLPSGRNRGGVMVDVWTG